MKRLGLMIIVIFIIIIVGLLFWSMGRTRSWRNIQQNDLSSDMQNYLLIPVGATDISCWMRAGFGGSKYFECTLSPEQLAAYVEQHNWQLKPIETKIRLYCPFGNSKTKIFLTGQYYEEKQKDGGGIKLIYIPETGRLFMEASAR